MLEIKRRDAAGRLCTFQTQHGTITTPALMPVLNPHQMILSAPEIQKSGAQCFITNSYIIYQDKTLKKQALQSGIHTLLDYTGPLMTDSGSFQAYQYDITVDPVEIVEFQRDIGADIGTIFDIITPPDAPIQKTQQDIAQTLQRGKKSVEHKGDMILAGTIQGSTHPKYRKKCAKEMGKLDMDFHPIGGVVPLMETQRYADIARIIIAAKKGLPPSRPVHLFGAGHPIIFPLAVALGCDFFDSAAYVKYAKDERLIFPDSTKKLEGLEELPCTCDICRKYSPHDLKEMDENQKIRNIAFHNLHQTFAEMKKIREAIREGSLWELVERRAVANPFLLDAMNIVRKEVKWLEKFESSAKKKAFFYTGPYSLNRPLIYRFQSRLLDRYVPHGTEIRFIEENGKPYSKFYTGNLNTEESIIVRTPFGPVPIELDEMYPFSQSVFPDTIDESSQKMAQKMEDKFYRQMKQYIDTNGNKKTKKRERFDITKLRVMADIQFGAGAGTALFTRDSKMVKSRKTGRIRSVSSGEKILVSLRASDGLLNLRREGGRRLHQYFPAPHMRVVIHDEAVPFVQEGKNVFSKFVVDAWTNLRPMEEVMVVDTKDHLVGIGKSLLNRDELLSFSRGMAIKIREGYPKG